MARGRAVALLVTVLFSCLGLSTCTFNITQVLAAYPDFSQLNDWFTKTGVAGEINNRSTLTILAPSNAVLQSYLSGVPNAWSDPSKVGDTLRYHVLLQYFGMTELQELPVNGTSVTTLLQTTGRANESQGFVTISKNGTAYVVRHKFTDAYGNETIMKNITQTPYVYSILEVSKVLAPSPPSLPSPTPAPSPAATAPSLSPTAPPLAPSTSETPTVKSPPGNFASQNGISKPIVLLAMLLASAAALL